MISLEKYSLFDSVRKKSHKSLSSEIAQSVSLFISNQTNPFTALKRCFRKVKNDLSQAGFENIDEEIRNKMNELMEAAKKAFS